MNKKIVAVFTVALILVIPAGIMLSKHFSAQENEKVSVAAKPENEEKKENEEKTEEEKIEEEPEEETQMDKEESTQSSTGGKVIVSNPDSMTVLLNKTHALPDGWAPSDLVLVNSNTGAAHYLRSEAAQAWESARTAALNSGIKINIVSSYRTQQYQTNLYNYYMSFDAANAPYYSAYPRTSEHELGLAIDISFDGALHDDLNSSTVGSWMIENGWKYGWILRYPSGKEHITGYISEPWHFRYVGVDLATKLRNSGLTMDEYFG